MDTVRTRRGLRKSASNSPEHSNVTAEGRGGAWMRAGPGVLCWRGWAVCGVTALQADVWCDMKQMSNHSGDARRTDELLQCPTCGGLPRALFLLWTQRQLRPGGTRRPGDSDGTGSQSGWGRTAPLRSERLLIGCQVLLSSLMSLQGFDGVDVLRQLRLLPHQNLLLFQVLHPL